MFSNLFLNILPSLTEYRCFILTEITKAQLLCNFYSIKGKLFQPRRPFDELKFIQMRKYTSRKYCFVV